MSTCIDTGNIDENDSSNWEMFNAPYASTIYNPCWDCIHMPKGTNKQCDLSVAEVIYCKINGHCFKKKDDNCAVYLNVTQTKEFIAEEEFEI